jgi:hypothetical protein
LFGSGTSRLADLVLGRDEHCSSRLSAINWISGTDRLEAAWNIDVLDQTGGTASAVLKDLKRARSLTASPDSSLLASSSTDASARGPGCSLFSLTRKSLTRVSTEKMDWIRHLMVE